MNAKSLLIPVAAFAVTVTGVSAFNSDVLQNAGLTDDQISAFEEARELREDGDKEGARDVLVEAGIDHDTMEKVREAMHEYRNEHRDAIREAVENEDYDAFKTAVEGSPLADIITSKDDFEQFVEAHQLLEEGDKEAAQDIFDDLGLERPKEGMGRHGEMHGPGNIEEAPFWDELSSSDQDAIKAALENHDRDKVKEILDNAGIQMPEPPEGGRHDRNIENAPFWDELSSSDQEAIKAAIENHDRDKVKEILDNAGIKMPQPPQDGRGPQAGNNN